MQLQARRLLSHDLLSSSDQKTMAAQVIKTSRKKTTFNNSSFVCLRWCVRPLLGQDTRARRQEDSNHRRRHVEHDNWTPCFDECLSLLKGCRLNCHVESQQRDRHRSFEQDVVGHSDEGDRRIAGHRDFLLLLHTHGSTSIRELQSIRSRR